MNINKEIGEPGKKPRVYDYIPRQSEDEPHIQTYHIPSNTVRQWDVLKNVVLDSL